jgi:5'-phosphate synthase pdxT subunit
VKVGLLALQGAVGLHAAAFDALGVTTVEVRTEVQLADVDALVVPGGESTTMSKLLVSNHLFEPVGRRLADGMPAMGTCAGMIVLAADVLDGRPDQRSFAAIDIGVRRNAFGRQVDSFEAPLAVTEVAGDAFPGVFIRAPFVERVGRAVTVIAEVDGHPVACRQGNVLVTAFHPELAADPVSGTQDLRVHELFLGLVG